MNDQNLQATKTDAVKAAANPVNVVMSTTSQNVMGGIALTATGALSLIAFVRSVVELPWGPEHDEFAAAALVTVFAPLVSRIIAFLRDRQKVA